MKHQTVVATVLLGGVLLWAAPAAAQQEEMAEAMAAWQQAGQPGAQHEHLAKYVGSWQAEGKMWMDPSGEPTTMSSTAEYRMIMDGRFLEEIITSDLMGQPFYGRGIYGYNNLTGEVQAVWIDNMSTGIYSYVGTINEAGDEIVLVGSYTDPVTMERGETRSVMTISENEIRSVAYQIVNGQEQKTMEVIARRVRS
jgi:hypothetical protein